MCYNDAKMEYLMAEAILGGGCFWCLEGAFEIVDGILDVESGYANGNTPNPTYKEVCSDTTGYAEVVKITYDESLIDYERILEIFFAIHDPTTLNRQGADYGSQYRSIIIALNDTQYHQAKEYINKIQSKYDKKIVTSVERLKNYYKAEDYHQDYYQHNSTQPYCQAVALPKILKVKEMISKD
jgi:peptide-methionine (S)-S-oxide reductase